MPKRNNNMQYNEPDRRMQRRRVLTGSNLLVALIGFLFLVSLSVVLVLNLRSIYYFDIEYLDLPGQTGLSAEIIKKNYDALIDYNLVTSGLKELEFPSFPMSESGRIHFAEVKQIFVVIQHLLAVSGVFWLIGLWGKIGRRDYGSLKLLSIFTFAIPTVLGALAFFWWDQVFVLFHKIFFNNDYWLFDPSTDPVIWILPDMFFGHCAAAILIFILLGGVVVGVIYRITTRKYRYRR